MAETGEGLPAISGPHLMIRLHGLEEQPIVVLPGNCHGIRLIFSTVMDFVTNIDGVIVCSGIRGSYAAVMRTGCVEWHLGLTAIPGYRDGPNRPWLSLANFLADFSKNAAPSAVRWLREAGVRGPLMLSADLSGVQGLAIFCDGLESMPDYEYEKVRFGRNHIMTPAIRFDGSNFGLANALADICTEIWRAGGHEAPPDYLTRDALVSRLAPTTCE